MPTALLASIGRQGVIKSQSKLIFPHFMINSQFLKPARLYDIAARTSTNSKVELGPGIVRARVEGQDEPEGAVIAENLAAGPVRHLNFSKVNRRKKQRTLPQLSPNLQAAQTNPCPAKVVKVGRSTLTYKVSIDTRELHPKSDLLFIAEHEAAHAVMRWLCGMPATELTVSEEGGYCAGSGERIDAIDNLMVTLAGVAWECRNHLKGVDTICWSPGFPDMDEAVQILEHSSGLRTFRVGDAFKILDPIAAVRCWLEKLGRLILDHAEIIESLSLALSEARRLSAKQVAAHLREYLNRFDDPEMREQYRRRWKSHLRVMDKF